MSIIIFKPSSKIYGLIASIVGMVLPAASGIASEEMVASSASILFYNSPAAVRLPGGDHAIGVINGYGQVEVAFISPQGGTTKQVIHTYSHQDDHGAPALWPADGGLYVATAIHSSDLFVYYISADQEAQLACHLKGRYTYPRFYDDHGLRLLVRRDQLEDTAMENYRGMLSTVAVSYNGCGESTDLIDPGFRNWVYATPPVEFSGGITVAWSIYNQPTNSYSGLFIGTIADDRLIRKRSVRNIIDGYDVVAWGLGYWGQVPAISAVKFTGGYECCNTGSQVQEVLSLDGLELFRSIPSTVPYYPDGLSLSQSLGSTIQTCAPKGASSVMPIKDDDGQVYMMLGPTHSAKNFSSSVWICSVKRAAYK